MINTYKVTFCTSLILFFNRYAFSMKSWENKCLQSEKQTEKSKKIFFIGKISQREVILNLFYRIYQVVDFIFLLRRKETIFYI